MAERYLGAPAWNASAAHAPNEACESSMGSVRFVVDPLGERPVRLRTARVTSDAVRADIGEALARWSRTSAACVATLLAADLEGAECWWASDALPGPGLGPSQLGLREAGELLQGLARLHESGVVIGGVVPARVRRDATGVWRFVEASVERALRAPVEGPCIVDRALAPWLPLSALRDPSAWSPAHDRWNLLALVCWSVTGLRPDAPELVEQAFTRLGVRDDAPASVDRVGLGAAWSNAMREAEGGRASPLRCAALQDVIGRLLNVPIPARVPSMRSTQPETGDLMAAPPVIPPRATPAARHAMAVSEAPTPLPSPTPDADASERIRAKLERYDALLQRGKK